MLLGANGRQVDAGHSTAAVAVGQRRVAVMQLCYLRNETQAQATTAAPAVGSRQRVEAFEHATDRVVRYARAGIGNNDAHEQRGREWGRERERQDRERKGGA